MQTNSTSFDWHVITAATAERRAALVWRVWFAVFMVATGAAALLLRNTPANETATAPIAWLVFVLSLLVIIYRPRYGLYLIVFFSLLGDTVMTPEYPFNKDFSSAESLFYIGRSLNFNPLELCLIVTALSWLVRGLMQRKLKIYVSPLTGPALLFLGFILFGVVWGVGRGGSLNVALWEVRAICYLPLMIVLVTNLLEKREHINNLIWAAMLALFIESLDAAYTVFVDLHGSLAGIQAIAEHAMSVQEATLIVLVIASWLYGASPAKRFLLPLMMPSVLLAIIANQRRASYVVLLLAIVLIGVVLYKVRRKLFWFILPPLAIAGMIYLAVYWNSSYGSAGALARAVRSVVAPKQGSRDDLSNVYRQIENVDTTFNIHHAPLTGIGFGQKFNVLVPLPDISFFIWYQYITHNSILWIWMQTGAGGFFSMIFLLGMALMTGVRATLHAPRGDMAAIALTATLYVVMHFVYAYVDISWEARSMVYVGAMMGVIGVLEHVVSMPAPARPRRWPWQPQPVPPPALVPEAG